MNLRPLRVIRHEEYTAYTYLETAHWLYRTELGYIIISLYINFMFTPSCMCAIACVPRYCHTKMHYYGLAVRSPYVGMARFQDGGSNDRYFSCEHEYNYE